MKFFQSRRKIPISRHVSEESIATDDDTIESLQFHINSGNWDRLRSSLNVPKKRMKKSIKNERKSQKRSSRSSVSSSSHSLFHNDEADNSKSLLLDACKQDAPYDILKNLLEIDPLFASHAHPDSKRTCLHVAVMNAAEYRVIKLLVDAWPNAGLARDFFDRTPLHIACMSSTNFLSRESFLLICRVGVRACCTLDRDGMTPLDHAMHNNVPSDCLALLKIYTEKCWLSQSSLGSSSNSEGRNNEHI